MTDGETPPPESGDTARKRQPLPLVWQVRARILAGTGMSREDIRRQVLLGPEKTAPKADPAPEAAPPPSEPRPAAQTPPPKTASPPKAPHQPLFRQAPKTPARDHGTTTDDSNVLRDRLNQALSAIGDLEPRDKGTRE